MSILQMKKQSEVFLQSFFETSKGIDTILIDIYNRSLKNAWSSLIVRNLYHSLFSQIIFLFHISQNFFLTESMLMPEESSLREICI